MTDFRKIIDSNYVLIDKTRFLKIYEERGTSVSLFLRPRRFGKTMFTELLRYYYDKALESESNRLFKGCYIASHPTPLKSSFYVLQFDFSGIATSGCSETLNYDEGVSLLFNMGFLTIMSREEIEATPNGCNLEGHASGSPMITLKLCFLEFSLKTVRICFEVLKNS